MLKLLESRQGGGGGGRFFFFFKVFFRPLGEILCCILG